MAEHSLQLQSPESEEPSLHDDDEHDTFWAASGLTDEALISAALFGDEDAFSTLCIRYAPALRRILSRESQTQLAEDALQEGLLAAWLALDTLRDPKHFGVWLKAIVRNKLRRLQKRPHPIALPPEHLPEPQDNHPDALTRLLGLESQQQLLEHLAKLPEKERLPLELHYFDDLPLRRIAAVLGLNVSTIKWRMFQARKKLRDALNAQEENPS